MSKSDSNIFDAPPLGPGSKRRLDADVGYVQSSAAAGWLDMPMYRYAGGYRNAAVAVYETAVRERQPPETMIWPQAFLWRHHIELMLKWVIGTGKKLRGEPSTFPEHHDLLRLWSDAKVYLVDENGDPDAAIVGADARITEFATIDPGSFGFRYPVSKVDKKSGSSGPSLPNSPSVINLDVLHEAMSELSDFLDACVTELTVQIDTLSDAELYSRG